MKLTNNFSLSEFECKCGCEMPAFVEENIKELAENLQVFRPDTCPVHEPCVFKRGD